MDKWVPFADLRNARPFAPAYKIGETDVFSATFSGHGKELKEAFQKLGGKKLPQGDVGYEIRAFECMPLRFFFWEKDEEFEAQGNILFTVLRISIMWKVRYLLQMWGSDVWQSWLVYR